MYVLDSLSYSVAQSVTAYENVREDQELVYEMKAYGNTLVRVCKEVLL